MVGWVAGWFCALPRSPRIRKNTQTDFCYVTLKVQPFSCLSQHGQLLKLFRLSIVNIIKWKTKRTHVYGVNRTVIHVLSETLSQDLSDCLWTKILCHAKPRHILYTQCQMNTSLPHWHFRGTHTHFRLDNARNFQPSDFFTLFRNLRFHGCSILAKKEHVSSH